MFDTTVVGQQYKRINKIIIDYPAPMQAIVSFTEQDFVPLKDGSHAAIGSENQNSFEVHQGNMLDTVRLSDTNTGEDLGVSMSYAQIMLGIVAAIRDHQK